MKRQTIVFLDDIDGTEGAQTVAFSFRGVNYEIDLNAEHEAEMAADLEKWIEYARRVARVRTRSASATRPGVASEARAWLIANNFTVPARGRIPAALLEEFFTANPDKRA